MKTCSITQFLEAIDPWLSTEYIRKGYINKDGDLVLMFNDGVNNVYRITDCTRTQLDNVIEKIRNQGISFDTTDAS